MKRAIVIGASSGIGRELATVLSRNDFTVGVTGRRLDLLMELKGDLDNAVFIKQMDVSDCAGAMAQFEDLIEEMGGVDLVVISAGVGFINPDLDWAKEKETLDVNVCGFAAIANVAFRRFAQAGRGHLVGISSIAAIRGGGGGPAYNASKAFVSNYLEGLRIRASRARLSITVTDILPGYVETAMLKGRGHFWVASPQEAAQQIYEAIQRKAKRAYITRRWRVIGWLLGALPDFVYYRF
jgi:short-subunit dehydrogenase